jgi:Potential Queuosine, Q, salvage protein family
MSDDEADPELLELLRQHLGLSSGPSSGPPDTGVLKDAQYVCDNSLDVALDFQGTRTAAEHIYQQMQGREYSTSSWHEHELHPKLEEGKEEEVLSFVFTMDLLNFSFWSDHDDGKGKEPGESEKFAVEYDGKTYTGYKSLVASLRRALDEDIPITTPSFWHDAEECPDDKIRHVFRSASNEEIPLLDERIRILREAAEVLCKDFDLSLPNLISQANGSAASLVNLLAEHFPCFRDQVRFEGKTIRLLKRAQIFAADLWACFDGKSYGAFDDIDSLTMFADYRVPQMLHSLGSLVYSPPLESKLKRRVHIEPGSQYEVEIRGCSIWCVEMIRKEILRAHPEAKVNAVLIDFFLYDVCKEMEKALKEGGEELDMLPHHRTRCIWY